VEISIQHFSFWVDACHREIFYLHGWWTLFGHDIYLILLLGRKKGFGFVGLGNMFGDCSWIGDRLGG